MMSGPRVAVVLDGGGARAAYQVGLLRVLARHFPRLRLSVVCGVSAGAINAAYLANHTGSFAQAVEGLAKLWSSLTADQIFRADALNLALGLLRSGAALLSAGRLRSSGTRSMVSTAPLRRLLTRELHATAAGRLTGVTANLAHGSLDAVALVTINYATGDTVSWVQGHGITAWQRPNRCALRTELGVEHVMASAALPLFFPAVRIGDSWYGDGGVRQAAPLAPAIHLGAERIIAVSTRYVGTSLETAQREPHPYPPPAQILGVLFDSIFLDSLDWDAHVLERVNRLLRWVPPGERDGLRPIDLFVLRPSADLGALASQREPQLPYAFRFLMRGLGTRESESPAALSMLMFEPGFIAEVIRAGEVDAEKRIDELASLVGP